MSARESSNPVIETPVDEGGVAAFTRWRGLLSLSLGILLGPTIVLANQQLIYATTMWACGRNLQAAIHIVPALSLIVTIGIILSTHRNWRAVGGGIEDEAATIPTRTRFLALAGLVTSIFSAMFILAMWAAVFVFDPCMRA